MFQNVLYFCLFAQNYNLALRSLICSGYINHSASLFLPHSELSVFMLCLLSCRAFWQEHWISSLSQQLTVVILKDPFLELLWSVQISMHIMQFAIHGDQFQNLVFSADYLKVAELQPCWTQFSDFENLSSQIMTATMLAFAKKKTMLQQQQQWSV